LLQKLSGLLFLAHPVFVYSPFMCSDDIQGSFTDENFTLGDFWPNFFVHKFAKVPLF